MKITHGLILTIQTIAIIPYTAAFVMILKKRFGIGSKLWILLGLALDVVMALLGSLFSRLGENPHGVHWGNPLFIAHCVLASIGMFGFVLLLILIWLFIGRKTVEGFVAYAVWVIYPCWILGVGIATANVLSGQGLY